MVAAQAAAILAMPKTTPQPTGYVGRFAPSPTGPLHLGSLVAALASFLDARHRNGKWLVRIEDIDPPREQAGATDEILRALQAHGLNGDGPVMYQSQRIEIYQTAANRLIEQQQAFYCGCSRLQLKDHKVYPGSCRGQLSSPSQPAAIRVIAQGNIDFADRIQGHQRNNMATEVGDFVIYRKDGLVAYQLATALDDHLQGITHVVRGNDLLDSTSRQIYLQKIFGVSSPEYAHIPVLANANGQKLSKQNLATPLDLNCCQQNLFQALTWLNQNPPEALSSQSVPSILHWGTTHWDISRIAPISSIQIS